MARSTIDPMPPANKGSTPAQRVRALNDAPLCAGDYVLYWMVAARRTRANFGLQRAAELSRELQRPLLVLEPLRAGYRWASDRLHAFVIQGMADNAAALAAAGVAHYPYVEPAPGAGRGLLAALAARACAVVTDDWPCFFIPRMQAAAAKLPVRIEAVDSCGIYPLHAAQRAFHSAHSFRIHLHKVLRPYLHEWPQLEPLANVPGGPCDIPSDVLARWPAADPGNVNLAALPIDHDVPQSLVRGGSVAAQAALRSFLHLRLGLYHEDRNHPDDGAASGLSPWLHFGHIGAHEIVQSVWEREEWSPDKVVGKPIGKRHGWWGLSEPAESFLDELITWRELGLQFCRAFPDSYDSFENLPAFARQTLARHASDDRPHLYTPEQLENARTHDEVWNAAQRELVREGRMNNYLRMLWGKKILEWSKTPRQSAETMIHLNNKYALDGRDPNSYSGIFWCLGRFDRAWGPERPIFGKIRYMTSQSTRRKLRMEQYLARFSAD